MVALLKAEVVEGPLEVGVWQPFGKGYKSGKTVVHLRTRRAKRRSLERGPGCIGVPDVPPRGVHGLGLEPVYCTSPGLSIVILGPRPFPRDLLPSKTTLLPSRTLGFGLPSGHLILAPHRQ